MTTFYTVEYRARKSSTPDHEVFWQYRKVSGFTSRNNAEKSLVELAKHPEFRGGGISSTSWDDDEEETA
jgi:hypothetical protein